eukprot:6579119-Prymnesium_polylepis.1
MGDVSAELGKPPDPACRSAATAAAAMMLVSAVAAAAACGNHAPSTFSQSMPSERCYAGCVDMQRRGQVQGECAPPVWIPPRT